MKGIGSPKSLAYLAILFLTVTVAAAYSLLQVSIKIPAVGKVKGVNIQVYSDSQCSIVLVQIDWGLLSPGENKSFVCYLKSESTVNVVLILAAQDWNPTAAGQYIVLSWNREGFTLQPGQAAEAKLALYVSPSIAGVTSFSFTIIVTASEG